MPGIVAREDASILHADLDSFYASVEQRDDGRLRGRPVIVGGGVVLAASYEAKACGVRTVMTRREARRRCPDLVEVPPRMRAYSEASRAGHPPQAPDVEEPLPVERLWGVGRLTARKLHDRGIALVGEVASLPEEALVAMLGAAAGHHLHALAHNRDPRRVQTGRRRRSMGAQQALGRGHASVTTSTCSSPCRSALRTIPGSTPPSTRCASASVAARSPAPRCWVGARRGRYPCSPTDRGVWSEGSGRFTIDVGGGAMSTDPRSIKLPGTPKPWMNSFMTTMLRAPGVRSLLGKGFMILTVTGAKSGKRYTTPVQYVRDGDRLLVLSQRTRKWWRNIAVRPDVEVVLRGDTIRGRARLAEGDEARAGIGTVLRGDRRTARFYGITIDRSGEPDPHGVEQLDEAFVVIVIDLPGPDGRGS